MNATEPASGSQDYRMMGLALRVARRVLGQTAPNPAVGAIIADEATGEVVARGWTQISGRPHAEAHALATAGANLIAIPAAFTKQTGQAHWHVLLRARAIETGSFVLAATQGGLHENGRETYGHSMIVSPWGDILSEAGGDPCVIFAEIDLARSDEARAAIPALKHGRPFEIEPAGDEPDFVRKELS